MENTNSNKTVWTVVIVVIIVILLGVWVWSANSNKTSDMNQNGGNMSTTTMATSSTESNGTEVGTATGEPAIAYSSALQTYANKRIQFSTPVAENSCQADPNTLTFKGGTKFMLDNRMSRTANIHFSSGVTYTLPAYSFQIVSLATPATYNVDCNTSQNVVKVQIQK